MRSLDLVFTVDQQRNSHSYEVYGCKYNRNGYCHIMKGTAPAQLCSGEWFNGKTAAFKVADLGSNPCSPAKSISMDYLVATSGRSLSVKYLVLSSTPVIIFERRCSH